MAAAPASATAAAAAASAPKPTPAPVATATANGAAASAAGDDEDDEDDYDDDDYDDYEDDFEPLESPKKQSRAAPPLPLATNLAKPGVGVGAGAGAGGLLPIATPRNPLQPQEIDNLELEDLCKRLEDSVLEMDEHRKSSVRVLCG